MNFTKMCTLVRAKPQTKAGESKFHLMNGPRKALFVHNYIHSQTELCNFKIRGVVNKLFGLKVATIIKIVISKWWNNILATNS